MKRSKFDISFEKLDAIYLINLFCFKKVKLIHKRNYKYIMLESIRSKQAPSMNRKTKENVRVTFSRFLRKILSNQSCKYDFSLAFIQNRE